MRLVEKDLVAGIEDEGWRVMVCLCVMHSGILAILTYVDVC